MSTARKEPSLFLRDFQKTAMIYRGEEISYSRLIQAALRVAAACPLARGERSAIFAENRPEWAAAFFGAWHHGGINVPIDALSTPEEVAYILRDCAPSRIFCSPTTRPVLVAALALLEGEPRLEIRDLEESLPAAAAPAEVLPHPDDVAVLIYTSGTTGGPKGVMLTYDNLLTNIEEVVEDTRIITRKERLLGILPFHHIFALQGNLLAPMSSGATVVLLEKLGSDEILQALQAHRITILLGVPRLYKLFHQGLMSKVKASLPVRVLLALSRATGGAALGRVLFAKVQKAFGGSIAFLVSGGAKLDEVVARDLRAMGFEILEGYGMTEAAPMITFTRPGEVCIGSPGRATRYTQLRIEQGEILASGRHVMKGYWNRPEETAAVLREGWLHTGDQGHLDGKGRLFVTGRTKEIIVLPNGKNINPEEIENRLLSLSPLIKEIGVYPLEDTLAAVIHPDKAAVRRERIVNLRETLRLQVLDKFNLHAPGYKRIHQFFLVEEELPKTRLGKLKRFLLPKLAQQVTAERPSVPDPDQEEYRLLKAYLAAGRDQAIHPDDHLEYDLGLDSLAKIELDLFMEKTFGIALPEDEPASHFTVRGLAERAAALRTRAEAEAPDWSHLLAEAEGSKAVPDSIAMLRVMQALALPLRPFFRLEVTGLDRIPEGPCIFAPNHQSLFDGLFLSYAVPDRILRRTHFLATERHFRGGFTRFYARHANILVMDINRDLKGTLQAAAALLRAGRNLMIFPEGTRTRDGHMLPFRKTFAILAKELGVPVVPVAISGAYEAFPVDRRLPRPGHISLHFLDPLEPGGLSPESLTEHTQAVVAAHVRHTAT